MAGNTGEGDDVTDVFHARHKQEQALEAQTESSVGGGTVLAKVDVPVVMAAIVLRQWQKKEEGG